ncbi:adenylyltransferase/cytidyltransferase family protein [Candidatus Nitrospira neomarina]|uniref:Adenylyltransferase/cytidyltransferase family protein n=1 Tax=Candidatus Nitrospira neomarina TaxID=3020899 RepID=A0AA96GS98_9BACT|nr:adenylyltransferase/cytidyltransferase family protein [Candidatus Nitrospira neomarina]WNM63139.1 adenylyltransferase/cytidyltransferase family protein [Candidatus Nitrospira neomarina]
MKRESIAVIHGRFQPLHMGHLEYLLAGKQMADVLIVGITSPDPWLLGEEQAAPERGDPLANPCTYWERLLMVSSSLIESGVSRDEFYIVPFPHSYPERLKYYAPSDALYLLTIYDEWGEVKRQRLESLGLRTSVLWRRKKKVTSGTELRRLIVEGGDWKSKIPSAALKVILEHAIDDRIRANLSGR